MRLVGEEGYLPAKTCIMYARNANHGRDRCMQIESRVPERKKSCSILVMEKCKSHAREMQQVQENRKRQIETRIREKDLVVSGITVLERFCEVRAQQGFDA